MQLDQQILLSIKAQWLVVRLNFFIKTRLITHGIEYNSLRPLVKRIYSLIYLSFNLIILSQRSKKLNILFITLFIDYDLMNITH